MIKITAKQNAFPEIKYLISAWEIDTHRPYIGIIHVDKGIAYASNGHVMHTSNMTGLDDGQYEVEKNSRNFVILQPVIKDFLPVNDALSCFNGEYIYIGLFSIEQNIFVQYRTFLLCDKEILINFDYFRTVITHIDCDCHVLDSDNPVVFISPDKTKTAYLMPIRE